ncbi:MAG TPA: sigma-70 family RNA polymerase sigma factor [Chloroflexia bacterium]|nr:sigma-70 family RNA polymerase sigma factor [Chloroflexia bacterium]
MQNHWQSPAYQSERALLTAVAAGRRDAVTELYDRYFGVTYALALRMTGDSAGAEACVHAAFVDLWQQPTVARDGDDIGTLLLTMVHGHARSRQRAMEPRDRAGAWPAAPRRAGSGAGADRSLAATPARTGTRGVLAARQQQARLAMASLDAQDRAVLELAFFDGLTAGQIAETLGQPRADVHQRLGRGMRHLTAALAVSQPAPAATAHHDGLSTREDPGAAAPGMFVPVPRRDYGESDLLQ